MAVVRTTRLVEHKTYDGQYPKVLKEREKIGILGNTSTVMLTYGYRYLRYNTGFICSLSLLYLLTSRMSDQFRSLLDSFKVATGTSDALPREESTSKNLKENIQNLWRRSQIQKSIAQQSKPKSDSKGVNNGHNYSSPTSATDPIHLAICATIVSTFPHEAIWNSWLEHDTESATASIYVHAKTPSSIRKNSWLKSKCLPLSHNPNWNDIKIVRAMLSLIEFALKDERTTHIMFVTESCIPIATIDELANSLRNEGTVGKECCCSFLDAYGRDSARCTRFDEHACFKVRDIPETAIHKALPGWCLLSRKHAEQIFKLPSQLGNDLYPMFEGVWAPEEVFFPTALCLLGFLPGNEVISKSMMWAKWDERARTRERAHPIEYDGKFDQNLVDFVRANGCMFMRKLKKPLDVRTWEIIIYSGKRNNKSSSAGAPKSNKKRPREDAKEIENNKKNHKDISEVGKVIN